MYEPRRIEDIQREIYRQLQTNNSQLTDATPGSVLYSLTRSFAGVQLTSDQMLYELATRFFLSTASGQALDVRASDYGVQRKPPTRASGYVLMRSKEGSLRIYPGGVLTEPITGLQFITALTSEINAREEVEIKIPITAKVPGAASNLAPGTAMVDSINSTVAIVVGALRNVSGHVLGGLTGGADEESDESLRLRAAQTLILRESCTEEALIAAVYADPRVTWATAHRPFAGHTQVWIEVNVPDVTSVLNELNVVLENIRPVGTFISVHGAAVQYVEFSVLFQKIANTDYNEATGAIESTIWDYCLRLHYGAPLRRPDLIYALKKVKAMRFLKLDSPEENVTPASGHVLRPGNVEIKYDVY